jgi:hypothetical protein
MVKTQEASQRYSKAQAMEASSELQRKRSACLNTFNYCIISNISIGMSKKLHLVALATVAIFRHIAPVFNSSDRQDNRSQRALIASKPVLAESDALK